MPLSPGTSTATFSHNVGEMIAAGHPRDQALAAAFREKRMSRARGGATEFGLPRVPENVLADDLALYDAQMTLRILPGEYNITAGGRSDQDLLTAALTLA